MADEFKVQASPKLGNTLVNVRGASWEEFKGEWDQFVENSGAFAQDVATVEAAYTLATGLKPAAATSTTSPAPAPAQAQDSTPPGPSCLHGAMTYRSGEKSGNKWEAYFCPAPKGDAQCDPEWIGNKKGRR